MEDDGIEMRVRSWANFIALDPPPMFRVRLDGLIYTLSELGLVRDDGGDPGDEDPGPHTNPLREDLEEP